MRAKTKKTFTNELREYLGDKKYYPLIDSVSTKVRFTLMKGGFLTFPYVNSLGDYKVVLELVSSFIEKLFDDGISEFPTILLKNIDSNIIEFQFNGSDGFVGDRYKKFLNNLEIKLNHLKTIDITNIHGIQEYNSIVDEYSLSLKGVEKIEIEKINPLNNIEAIVDKMTDIVDDNGFSDEF